MTSLSNAILQRHEDASANLEASQGILELQIELENITLFSSELKRENADLKRQLRDADAFSKANLHRHAEWKEAWKKEREIVFAREKQLEAKSKVNNEQIEEQRKKNQQIERKNGADGGVHLHLLKDLQAEHASKIEKLTQEASKWREKFYDSLRGFEELQAQKTGLQSQIEREKDIAESFQKEITSLQKAFAEHIEESARNSTSSTSSAVIARDLKLQLEEKDLLLERLHHELNGLQKARDDAVCSKDELIVSHQAEHVKIIQERAKSDAKCKTLAQRLHAAERELMQATKHSAELAQSLKCANKELDILRETLLAKEEGYKQEVVARQMESAKSISKLKMQVTSTEAVLAEEQVKTKELERRCVETQEHAMKQIAALAKDLKHDDNSDKLLIAQDQLFKLENKCANLQNEIKQLAQSHQAEVQRLQHACESCHKDLNLVLLEKKETEKNTAVERIKATELRKELEDSGRSTQKLEAKYQLLVDEKMKLTQNLECLKSENDSLESKVDLLKEQAMSDREKAEELLQGEKEKYVREKRRSVAYKGKAIEAHQRSIKAKEVLDSLM